MFSICASQIGYSLNWSYKTSKLPTVKNCFTETNGCPPQAENSLSRKIIWNLDQNNLHAFVRRWTSPSDDFCHLFQNLMLKMSFSFHCRISLLFHEWKQLLVVCCFKLWHIPVFINYSCSVLQWFIPRRPLIRFAPAVPLCRSLNTVAFVGNSSILNVVHSSHFCTWLFEPYAELSAAFTVGLIFSEKKYSAFNTRYSWVFAALSGKNTTHILVGKVLPLGIQDKSKASKWGRPWYKHHYHRHVRYRQYATTRYVNVLCTVDLHFKPRFASF